MKNKKGFTLVELLVVIVIIGLLIAIAIPSGLAISKKIKQKMLDSKIEIIESGAIVYGQNNETEILPLASSNCNEEIKNEANVTACIKMPLSKLLDENALEEDKNDDAGNKVLINPTNNQPLNDCNVEIYIKNKRVYAKYDITGTNCYYSNGEAEPETPEDPEELAFLLERDNTFSDENFYSERENIIKISFVNHINHGSSTIDCDDDTDKKWCVAKETENIREDTIIAWLEETIVDGSTKYILNIGSTEQIYAPIISDGLFGDFSNLMTIDFANFDTSQVTSMINMFSYSSSITNLDLRSFSTTNVEKMNGMFYECRQLKELNISSFVTTSVENMSQMFYHCDSLESLDLTHFNTEKVKDMSSMFLNCSALTNLSIGSFNTQKVETMETMFSGCINIVELDLVNFNTIFVENFSEMFSNTFELKSILLGENFSTSASTDMSNMFSQCGINNDESGTINIALEDAFERNVLTEACNNSTYCNINFLP